MSKKRPAAGQVSGGEFEIAPTVAEIAVPIANAPPAGSYVPQHVQAHLTRQQGIALQRLRHNLDTDNVRLEQTNRVVSNNSEAIRWVLEKIAERLDS